MENLEKEFVPYELSLKLKALCFNEPCFGYYENQSKILVINFNNLPLTEEQNKRPGLYTIDNRNEVLPQWAVAAPTFQQAFRWFREKHGLYSYVYTTLADIKLGDPIYGFSILDLHTKEYKYPKYQSKKNTHEEAELTCLEQLIEIAEQKHKENTRSMNKLIESNKKFDEQQKLGKNDRDSYEGGFDFGMWLSTIQ